MKTNKITSLDIEDLKREIVALRVVLMIKWGIPEEKIQSKLEEIGW